MPADKAAIMYESGANNNVSTISFCEKNTTNNNIIIALYSHTPSTPATSTTTEIVYTDTVNNYTLLYLSDALRSKLKVSGTAVSNNKSRYLWDNSNIVA